MTDQPIDENRAVLNSLMCGFQVSRMIRLVADLAIADKIPESGDTDVRELAAACAVLPTPLLRVLRALAAFEIFRVSAGGRVAHSPRSLLLRKEAPNSLYHAARFWTAPGSWKAWGSLDVALTGGVPHQDAWQKSRFEYLHEHPDEAQVFNAFMARFPDNRHPAIAAAYDFSSAALIADIGGGNGETLRHILARYPKARGIVFDRDDVLATITQADRAGGRIDVEAGSFFDRVPPGADLYLLVRVLHDWSDEDCVRILLTCGSAMPPHARLLIVEQLLEPDPTIGSPAAYLIDMQMMAMFGSARERTQAEFRDLLARTGFTAVRIIPTASAVSIIEAAGRA